MGRAKRGATALSALALLLTGALVGGADRPRTGIDAGTAFERIKALAGTWRGTQPGGGPVTIEYKVGVRGTTILETQNPGTDEEMVSVYSRDGAELVMTHYCPMGPVGNQPHMRLDRTRSTADSLIFDFTGGSNLDADKDTHVHSARITWLGAGGLRREWDVYEDGHKAGVTTFLLSRVP